MTEYFLGLDLGQMQDYTALAILQRHERIEERPHPRKHWQTITTKLPPHYECRHLDRLKLGTPYPEIVAHVCQLMNKHPLKGNCELVIDATGVGKPVVDMFKAAGLESARSVMITGGMTHNQESGIDYVPKRELVSVVQILLQSERLKVATTLPHAVTLQKELLNFQVKITLSANDTYGAAPWRDGGHDDLVLACSMAAWYGEQYGGCGTYQVRFRI